jgi:hypothetical protein
MRFRVSRTSANYDDKPCEEAVRGTYLHTDRRSSPAEAIPAYANPTVLQREWYGRGQNHRTEDGRAARELAHEGWFVTLPTLADLLAFIDKYGEVVVSHEPSPTPLYRLEIYDDYRE